MDSAHPVVNPMEMGKNGCLHLTQRFTPEIVTRYPIDENQVTIGSDPACNVRLYYDDVDPLHCRILFQERKAFLEIHGQNGLVVDGCPVSCRSPDPTGNTSGVTTIPLLNNTELIIHEKRFVFVYPPKDLREALAKLANTPSTTATPKRNLRLSMIQTAEVFTPKPHPNKMVNFKILKSPVKGRRSVSPVKQGTPKSHGTPRPSEIGEDIILVHGNCPDVKEEGADLIVLEDVPPPTPVVIQSTPVRPRGRRESLLRAAIHNSIKQAVLEHEDQEDASAVQQYFDESQENPEMETEEEQDYGPREPENYSHWPQDDGEESDASYESLGEPDENEQETQVKDTTEQIEHSDAGQSGGLGKALRKSLEVVGLVWPFRAGSVQAQEDNIEDKQDIAEASAGSDDGDEPREHDDDLGVNPRPAMLHRLSQEQAPVHAAARAPPLGKFMTPQRPALLRADSTARHSLGGADGAQRVKIASKWRVKDLPEEAEKERDHRSEAEVTESPTSRPAKPKTSVEERRAIQERRKSAWRTPDTFFGGHAPGLGGVVERRKSNIFAPLDESDIGEVNDTDVLLARMKETVDDMKKNRVPLSGEEDRSGESPRVMGERRMSMAERLSLSPTKRKLEWGRAVNLAATRDPDKDNEEDGDLATATALHMPSRADDVKGLGTPSFSGLTELFRVPVIPETPAMDGLKRMMQGNKGNEVIRTPALEGIAEMMSTPDGWLAKTVRLLDVSKTGTTIEPDRGVAGDTAVLSGTTCNGRLLRSKKSGKAVVETEPSTLTQRKAGKTGSDDLIDVSAATGKNNEAETSDVPKTTRRGRKATSEREESSQAAVLPATKSARKAFPIKLSIEEPVAAGSGDHEPAKSTRKPRAPKAPVAADPGEMIHDEDTPPPDSGRRVRAEEKDDDVPRRITKAKTKAKEPSQDIEPLAPTEREKHEETVATVPIKKTTKNRSRNPTAEGDHSKSIQHEEHEAVVPVAGPTKKSTKSRSRTATGVIDTVEGEEPQEAVISVVIASKKTRGRSRTASAETAPIESGEHSEPTPPVATKRAAKSRSRTASAQTNASEPTEGEDVNVGVSVIPAKKSTRGKGRTATAEAAPDQDGGMSKTPKTSSTRAPRTAKKGSATMRAETATPIDLDEDEELVKAKTVNGATRTKRIAKSVKEDMDIVEPPIRSRTRTRTGGKV